MQLSCEPNGQQIVGPTPRTAVEGVQSRTRKGIANAWVAGRNELRRTLMAKNNVNPIEPKYAAVNGSRGVEMRCWAYVTGPINTAHDAKNSTEPMVHLNNTTRRQHGCARILRADSGREVQSCYFRQLKHVLDRPPRRCGRGSSCALPAGLRTNT